MIKDYDNMFALMREKEIEYMGLIENYKKGSVLSQVSLPLKV